MNDDQNTPPETASETIKEKLPLFSWQLPENYTPKHDYYADLVMSYSAMTDIINPQAIECEYGDIRSLDSCILEQSLRLNEIAQKMLGGVFMSDGSINEKRLHNALRVQQAFRESYRNTNHAMTHRYLASTKPL